MTNSFPYCSPFITHVDIQSYLKIKLSQFGLWIWNFEGELKHILKKTQVLSISWAIWGECHKQTKGGSCDCSTKSHNLLDYPFWKMSFKWNTSVSLRPRVSYVLRRRYWRQQLRQTEISLLVTMASGWSSVSMCICMLRFPKKYETFNGSKIILITCNFRKWSGTGH